MLPCGASAGPSLRRAQLPFSHSGVFIEQSSSSVKVAAKLGLVFMWNQDDSLLVRRGAGLGGPGTCLRPGSLPREGRRCSGRRRVGKPDSPGPTAVRMGAQMLTGPQGPHP